MDHWTGAIQRISALIWGPWTVALFIGTGMYFSMRLHWLQIREAGTWLYESVGKYFRKENRRSLSGLKSVSTLLAATIGTGNLAGVAAALIAGGPGAIFWMWMAALLGMMTAFAENVLGVLYASPRAKGPMAYIRRIPGGRVLAGLYAGLCLLCGFGMGNLTQANTAAAAMKSAFGLSPFVVAVLLIVILGLVFAGGREALGRLTLIVTPFMTLLFLAAAALILLRHRERIPAAFGCIFREAFRPRAAAGGAAGYGIHTAMRLGVARGVFTNEAGIGTSVFANDQNESPQPSEQGYLAIFAVFADTVVMCTLTALILLASGVYDSSVYGAALAAGTLKELPDGAALLVRSFQETFGNAGGWFLAVLTFFFAFSTLLAWSGFAGQAYEYLTKGRGRLFFEFCFLCVVAGGVYAAAQIVWELSDIINGGMALINLSALLWLSGDVCNYNVRNLDENQKK